MWHVPPRSLKYLFLRKGSSWDPGRDPGQLARLQRQGPPHPRLVAGRASPEDTDAHRGHLTSSDPHSGPSEGHALPLGHLGLVAPPSPVWPFPSPCTPRL